MDIFDIGACILFGSLCLVVVASVIAFVVGVVGMVKTMIKELKED